MSNTTDQPDCQELVQGQVIPAFTLPGADGMPHSPWDYKQRENLLLLITQSATVESTSDWLHLFAQHYPAFREEKCAILALTADTVVTNLQAQEDLHLPFPLVSNARGEVLKQYTRWNNATDTPLPGVVLADRYGALHAHWSEEDLMSLPSVSELLKALFYLNSLCTP